MLARTLVIFGLLFAGLLTLSGCQSTRAAPLVQPADRHLVVLVHGVYGGASTFANMAEALEAHMGGADPRYRWEAVAFEYDTLSSTAGVEDFAQDLGDFLVRTFGKEPAAGDRFSIVAHSQGGLVASVWAARAATGDALFHPYLLPHFDAFTTLATPFWGNKIASWTRGMEPYRRAAGLPALEPGAKQLVDMTLGSDLHAAHRHHAIAAHQAGLPQALVHVRPLAMGGYVSWLRAAAALSAGEREYEDDTAVPLPSSRPDFIYAEIDDEGYVPQATVAPSAFASTSFAPWTAVDAIHVSPTVDMPQVTRGIAQVQSACVENLNCDHPTFGRVVDHLAGKIVSTSTAALPKMTSFLLELEVSLAGAPADGTEVEVTFDDEQPPGVEVQRRLEVFGAGRSLVLETPALQRLWFYGTADDTWTGEAHADREVRFTVSAPGYKPRRVRARVRATWSTWLAIRLEPGQAAAGPPLGPKTEDSSAVKSSSKASKGTSP